MKVCEIAYGTANINKATKIKSSRQELGFLILYSLLALPSAHAESSSWTPSNGGYADASSAYQNSKNPANSLQFSTSINKFSIANNSAYASTNQLISSPANLNVAHPLSKSFFDDLSIDESSSINLPDLGGGGDRFVEVNHHKALGEWSLRQLYGHLPIAYDPWSQEVLESMAWQINAQARNQAPIALVLVESSSINAFAIPGGVMGMHTGTITASSSMDEVASVMAHEVAHLSQRHYEHREESNKKALMLRIGGMLAAIAASSADGDAATAIMMGSQTAALNSEMAFSRSNEREADRIGMQLMAQSGYDPRAMPKFFMNLNQQTELNSSKQAYLPSFIMTHPLSSERLSEAQSRAKNYQPANLSQQQKHQAQFDLLKWRLKVLSNHSTEVELKAAAKNSHGASLALAYWYGSKGRFNEAQQLFNKLHNLPSDATVSDDVLLAITEAQVAGMQNQWAKAEAILKPYANLYPERRDIKLVLADTWLNQQKYSNVIRDLKPLLNTRAHDIDVLSRLQRAYEIMANTTSEKTNNKGMADTGLANIGTINALRYRGQVEFWHGRYNDALVSLKQAQTVAEEVQQKSALAGNNHSENKNINVIPLLSSIADDMQKIKNARDFKP